MCFPSGSAVKHLPEIQETQEPWIRSLVREDPLEAGTATQSSILAWRIPWSRVHGAAKSQTQLRLHTYITME